MSKRGYELEKEIEDWILKLEGSSREDSPDKRSFRVPNSGAQTYLKGDVRTRISWLWKQLLIECKARKVNKSKKDKTEKSIKLEKNWLDKNREEAEKEGKLSAVIVSFKRTQANRLHVVIPLEHFEEILLKFKPQQNVDPCIGCDGATEPEFCKERCKDSKNPIHVKMPLVMNPLESLKIKKGEVADEEESNKEEV